MRTKILLAICLSFVSCAHSKDSRMPQKPDGLLCTLYKGVMYCSELLDPSKNYEYDSGFELFEKAQCMPLDTFQRYTSYVQELKNKAEKGCR